MTLLMRDQENLEKGFELGKQQGVQQGLELVAVQLLDVLDEQTISQKTGLSIERIQELKNEH